MVLIDEQPQIAELSKLEEVYQSLDDKTEGPCGMTTKERVKYTIKTMCMISDSAFYAWLKNPEMVKQRYRYDIAVVLNQNVATLFPKQNN